MTYVHIPARTQVFDYGDIGDALYLILDGVVDIVKPLEKTSNTSFKSQYELVAGLRGQASEGENVARQSLWTRMDRAGHNAIKEVEKEINQRRRKSFEQQNTVQLTVQTEGRSEKSNLDLKDKISYPEVRELMDEINNKDPNLEDNK